MNTQKIIVMLIVSMCAPLIASEVEPWPPVLDQVMPDISLTNLQGEKVQLHSVNNGKPVLIEYVGMNCPGCNAYLGANVKGIGVYPGQRAQKGLQSVAEYLPAYSKGIQIDDKRFTYVIMFFYGLDMQAPTLKDAVAYAKHYKLTEKENHVVLFGDKSFINDGTYGLIPGFHLADTNWKLVSDSTGHHPKNKFWDHTFPGLKKLINGKK
ncbi:MAG: redoxin domain-containing protein [Planctomycetes bacterium]|nr:redoxin domain-containing protein [Planctomycetota bacterium]